jgi:hypothetical protein
MIKALGKTFDGGTALIMALTPENLELLQKGKPISFNTRELGLPPMTVIITFGESNEVINASLMTRIGRRDERQQRIRLEKP